MVKEGTDEGREGSGQKKMATAVAAVALKMVSGEEECNQNP